MTTTRPDLINAWEIVKLMWAKYGEAIVTDRSSVALSVDEYRTIHWALARLREVMN